MVLIYGMLVVCSGAYYLMYLFFERVQKENSAHYEAQLSALQLSALQSRMEAVRAAEDAIRMGAPRSPPPAPDCHRDGSTGRQSCGAGLSGCRPKRLDEGKAIPVVPPAGAGCGIFILF